MLWQSSCPWFLTNWFWQEHQELSEARKQHSWRSVAIQVFMFFAYTDTQTTKNLDFSFWYFHLKHTYTHAKNTYLHTFYVRCLLWTFSICFSCLSVGERFFFCHYRIFRFVITYFFHLSGMLLLPHDCCETLLTYIYRYKHTYIRTERHTLSCWYCVKC